MFLSRGGMFGGQSGTGVEIDGRGFLGLGQPDRQREVQIVLDINRPLNDEYAVGIGLQNNLEHTLKKYDIKKPEITKENKFSMIAMEHLIKILNDQTLVDHHITILKAIHYLVESIGKDSIQFLPLIIPSILNWIGQEEGNEINSQHLSMYYLCLMHIIETVPQCIDEYQHMIFDTIEQVTLQQQHSSDISNFLNVIRLLKHINMKSEQKYLPQMNFILPRILQLIDQKRFSSDYTQGMNYSFGGYSTATMLIEGSSGLHHDGVSGSASGKGGRSANPSSMGQGGSKQIQEHDLKICKEALQMIQELKRVTKDDNLHLIIPLLVRVISRANYNDPGDETDFQLKIIETIKSLIGCKSFREYMATIVHTMINVMQLYNTHFAPKDSDQLFHIVTDLFCAMSSSLKIDFAPFIELIQATLKQMKRQSAEFSRHIEDTTKINLVDLFKFNLEMSTRHADGDNEDGDDDGPLQTFGFFDGAGGAGQPGKAGARVQGSTGKSADVDRDGKN